jgi:four helix bundle protein
MKVHNFKELNVWKKSIDLAVLCYEITSTFPPSEKYGIVSQLQRAAVSIASNIAEGCGRVSNNELRHFLTISMGSCYEVETQMILAFRFGYIKEEELRDFEALVSEVQRMLFGFYNSLK